MSHDSTKSEEGDEHLERVPSWVSGAGRWRAFWYGCARAFGVPGWILLVSASGFGVLAHDAGLSLGQAIFVMALYFGLPAQIAVADQLARDASVFAGAIAVALTGIRLLPMTVTLMPYLSGSNEKRRVGIGQIVAVHFIAVTAWFEGMRALPQVPSGLRVAHFIGIGTGLLSMTVVGTAAGFLLVEVVPSIVGAVLLFVSPTYFLLSLIDAGRLASDKLAIVLGCALAPVFFLLAPDFDLLITGLLGGTIAYVFDHAWAQAMENAGQSYYPKLQCAVPFTPVPGPRILIKPGPDSSHHERVLATAAVELTKQMELSSLHITFVDERQQGHLAKLGFLQRTDQQFHWHNDNYKSFEDFLDALSSRKRKTVRKERSRAVETGIDIELLHADAITPVHWDTFYKFYLDTGDRKWGTPYLNRDFFMRLGETMSEHCLLIMAMHGGQYIAGALHIIGGDCLYGRYWGASEHVPYLHFEVCYYQAIEYAIKHQLARVEAGAQGEHKLARGYKPTTTYSAHWIADPGLSDAVARYLAKERARVKHMHTMLEDFTPFKKTNAPAKDH